MERDKNFIGGYPMDSPPCCSAIRGRSVGGRPPRRPAPPRGRARLARPGRPATGPGRLGLGESVAGRVVAAEPVGPRAAAQRAGRGGAGSGCPVAVAGSESEPP